MQKNALKNGSAISLESISATFPVDLPASAVLPGFKAQMLYRDTAPGGRCRFVRDCLPVTKRQGSAIHEAVSIDSFDDDALETRLIRAEELLSAGDGPIMEGARITTSYGVLTLSLSTAFSERLEKPRGLRIIPIDPFLR